MPYDVLTPVLVKAVSAAVAYVAMLAGHGIGDHWLQTGPQACKKPLDGAESRWCSMWHCAKHVATWTAVVTVFVTGAFLWLGLPLRPEWLGAGMALNAATHFVADLRTPLIWLATKMRRASYVEMVQVVRPAGCDRYGPGTAVFHLDQTWHKAWMLPAALLVPGF